MLSSKKCRLFARGRWHPEDLARRAPRSAGRGSSESRALESVVLNLLFVAIEGAPQVGSDEHSEQMRRMKELASLQFGGEGSPNGAVAPSKEAMEAQFSLGASAMMAAFGKENGTSYSGPLTLERIEQAHALWSEAAEHALFSTTKEGRGAPKCAAKLRTVMTKTL